MDPVDPPAKVAGPAENGETRLPRDAGASEGATGAPGNAGPGAGSLGKDAPAHPERDDAPNTPVSSDRSRPPAGSTSGSASGSNSGTPGGHRHTQPTGAWTQISPTAVADTASTLCFGVVRVGGLPLAVPIETLAEVCAVSRLSQVFMSAPGLLGTLDLRSVLIPVLDIRAIESARPPAGETPPYAAILRHDAHLLAIGIDQAEGLIHVPQNQIQRIETPGRDQSDARLPGASPLPRRTVHGRALLTGSLIHQGMTISIIDPAALFDRPDMPAVRRFPRDGAGAAEGPDASEAGSAAGRVFGPGGIERRVRDRRAGTVPDSADGGNARESDGRRAERGATPSPTAGPGRSAGARDSRVAASEGPGAVAPFLTFTAGGATCALPAVAVHATVPRCQIEQNALTSGLCIGSITYHRQRIPVVRTADLIGLGEPDDRTNAEIVVLRCEGDDRLGFAVDTINRMIRIEERALQPPPAAASGHEGLLKGVLTFPGSADQIFVLDEARLAKNDTVAELAKLSRPQKATQKSEATLRKPNGDVVEERVRHLVFDVGISVASPVMQVLRIVTPPERVVARPSSDVPGLRGIFSLDGKPVPLVDLDQMLGLWGTGDGDARVLVVERGADLVGFAVHAVTGIETSAWKRTAPAGTPDQGAAVVQLGRGAERHVLPVLDLQRLAGDVVA